MLISVMPCTSGINFVFIGTPTLIVGYNLKRQCQLQNALGTLILRDLMVGCVSGKCGTASSQGRLLVSLEKLEVPQMILGKRDYHRFLRVTSLKILRF